MTTLFEQDEPLATKRQMSSWRRKYGLDAQEWYALLEKQEGVCKICENRPPGAVDHDHATGKVRGLLCKPCNGILGNWHDSPNVAERAASYLRGELD